MAPILRQPADEELLWRTASLEYERDVVKRIRAIPSTYRNQVVRWLQRRRDYRPYPFELMTLTFLVWVERVRGVTTLFLYKSESDIVDCLERVSTTIGEFAEYTPMLDTVQKTRRARAELAKDAVLVELCQSGLFEEMFRPDAADDLGLLVDMFVLDLAQH